MSKGKTLAFVHPDVSDLDYTHLDVSSAGFSDINHFAPRHFGAGHHSTMTFRTSRFPIRTLTIPDPGISHRNILHQDGLNTNVSDPDVLQFDILDPDVSHHDSLDTDGSQVNILILEIAQMYVLDQDVH